MMTIFSWDTLRIELFFYHFTSLNISLGSDLLYASWNQPLGLHGPEWKKTVIFFSVCKTS